MMFMYWRNNGEVLYERQLGFSLVEVLLAAGLFALIVTVFTAAIITGQEGARTSGERVRAVALAEEGMEAARNIRDATPNDPFSELTTGTHGLAVSGSEWTLSGTEDKTGIFTRTLAIASPDDNTRQITSTVTWDQTLQRTGASVSLVSYLTNWLSEVATEFGAWDSQIFQEGCLDVSGDNDGLRVEVRGSYAYAIRSGGNPDLLVVDISTSSTPAIADSLNLGGNPKDMVISGDYVFIASDSNGGELQIVDISTPASVSEVGSLNLSGNDDAVSVYVVESTAYLTRADNYLYIIDVSTPTSPSELGSIDLSAVGNDVYVNNSYAYVATDDNNPEVQIIDVSTPTSLTIDASINMSGNSNAVAVNGFSNKLLVGRSDGAVYIYDVTSPTIPSEDSSSYNQGTSINHISFASNNEYAFLATTDNSWEMQIVDITDTSNPSLFGSYNASGDPDYFGVAYASDLDKAVVATSGDDSEICVLGPYSAGSWASPLLAGQVNVSGRNNGWKVQVVGDYAYVIRTGGDPDFVVIDVSDTENPTQVASLNLSSSLGNIYVLGDYAYVVSSSNSEELQIVDVSTPTSPSKVGSFNALGARNAFGVYAVGSTVYMTRDGHGSTSELQIVNVAVPSVPTGLGSLDLGADGNEVYISGNYAYIASDHDSRELQVVDISNPALPSLVGSLNLSGNANADTITGFNNTVLIGRDDGVLHIVDVSTPASPTETSTYNALDDINDIAVGSSNTVAWLATDDNDMELQIIDISALVTPTLLGFVDAGGDYNGVAYEATDDFVVVVGEDDSAEIDIITP